MYTQCSVKTNLLGIQHNSLFPGNLVKKSRMSAERRDLRSCLWRRPWAKLDMHTSSRKGIHRAVACALPAPLALRQISPLQHFLVISHSTVSVPGIKPRLPGSWTKHIHPKSQLKKMYCILMQSQSSLYVYK